MLGSPPDHPPGEGLFGEMPGIAGASTAPIASRPKGRRMRRRAAGSGVLRRGRHRSIMSGVRPVQDRHGLPEVAVGRRRAPKPAASGLTAGPTRAGPSTPDPTGRLALPASDPDDPTG